MKQSMIRTLLAAGIVVSLASVICAQRRRYAQADLPLPKDDAEAGLLEVIKEAREEGRTWASVPVSDGKMLWLLAEAIDARHVVEIGTSTGYSGLWFCLALQKTGGKLTTFEYDAGRAATARRHFQQAGVEDMITLVEGDAHVNIGRLKEPIDLVFIDADKDGYVDYLNKLLPLVRPGGLILAHNLGMAPEYVEAVTADPNLEAVRYMEGGQLGITMKKR